MLVGEHMNHPVIVVAPEMPIVEALNIMKSNRIRRTPVVMDGKLVGIISDKDLLNASPSPATSLSVWEMNYLLSRITVKDVMTKKVFSVTEDTPLEEAARIMADNKIGGLPVLRGEEVVGIITETDLFKILVELMGAREPGVRVTVVIHDKLGQLAQLTNVIARAGGNFVAFGQIQGDTPAFRLVTFKVSGLEQEKVKQLVEPVVVNLVDIRIV